jgi:1-acylglycerone phosphate reductase
MYAASKASLISASEIWRLELAPLNVRVIVLITGGIATKFMSNMPSVELPENSYYRTIRDIIAKEPEEIPFAAKPEALAMDVLNYVERGTAGKIWIGGASSMARFAVWAFPTWLLVSIPDV